MKDRYVDMIEAQERKFKCGQAVRHKDGWTGKVERVLGDDAYGIRTDEGGYYATQNFNLLPI